MPPLISEEEIDAMDSVNNSDDESMSMEMLKDIRDGSKSHPSVNMREACYKINYHNKLSQAERKGVLLSMRNMGKDVYKAFKSFANEI